MSEQPWPMSCADADCAAAVGIIYCLSMSNALDLDISSVVLG